MTARQLEVLAAETGQTGRIDPTARFISDDQETYRTGLLSLSLTIRVRKQIKRGLSC